MPPAIVVVLIICLVGLFLIGKWEKQKKKDLEKQNENKVRNMWDEGDMYL